jgi:DNA-binding transcriptional MocR family regulator
MRSSEIRELLKLIDRPGMISFAGGIPDPALFNVAAFSAAYGRILGDAAAGARALQYSATEGHPPLRRWIAERMAAQGVSCEPDNILITSGSQQALDLIGKLFLDPGDGVLAAAPTYLGALQSFSAYEPRFLARAEATDDVKLIYLVPDFDNPTGETMDAAARQRALEIADRHDAWIVEDGAYAALRYEGEDVAPVAAFDQRRAGSIDEIRTLYCGTFSKTLSPALRIGWICGPRAVISRLTLIQQVGDLHTSTINQMAMHEVAVSSYDDQVARARDVYRSRRDTMLAALARHAPEGLSWTRPKGGLFIWLTLPAAMDAAALLQRAIARDVAFVPGAAFFFDGSGSDRLRLSFSLSGEAAIDEGIERLCMLVREEIDVPIPAAAIGA